MYDFKKNHFKFSNLLYPSPPPCCHLWNPSPSYVHPYPYSWSCHAYSRHPRYHLCEQNVNEMGTKWMGEKIEEDDCCTKTVLYNFCQF